MGRVPDTRSIGRLGAFVLVGLAVAAGCAGKSESSKGANEGDSGTSGIAGSGTGGSADGGTGGVNGGTGAVSKGGCGPKGGSNGKGGGCAAGGTSATGAGGVAGIGTGGMFGAAGVVGIGGTPEAGGMAGVGAAAGEGGTASMSGAECEVPEDCVMVNDCCGCRAEPKGAPGDCALPCVRDACGEIGVAETEVSCIMGRCVIARSCDRARVTCRVAEPECPDGTVPSADGSCWGPCLPPTECQWVTDCADCGDAACVEFQAQRSNFSCVTPASGCNPGNYCDCLGVCGFCSENQSGVECDCPVC